MKYCQDITEMIERAADIRLSFSEKMALRFHLFICKTCKRYSEDSKAMDILLSRRFKRVDDYSFSKLEKEELKNRL